VHETDFVPLDGADRVTATLTETRYGKWLRRAVSGKLGISVRDGEPIADKLRARAPLTMLAMVLAMLASYALAVPIGVVAAWRRQQPFDLASSGALFAMYSLPTFMVAEILRRVFGGGQALAPKVALAVIALTLASLATLSRHQRTAMLAVIRADYVRTARAKGMPGWRVFVVHALRNALLPTVTLAGLQLPALLGGAFVVEEVFALPGMGYETVRAVEAHDTSWLMATILLAAVVTTVGLVASDVGYGVLDPRVRESLARSAGART
jgi:peptide/nickel transport system permease protein